MTHCCPPSPHLHRLQQRAGVPHHANQASLKMYTRLCCQISQRKDSLFSTVSGEIQYFWFCSALDVMSVFECVCVSIHVSYASSPLCVRFQGGEKKTDIFKQLLFAVVGVVIQAV